MNNINVQIDKEYPLTRSQFLEKFELSHITEVSLKQKLCDLLWKYRDVFSTSEDDIGLIPFYEHANLYLFQETSNIIEMVLSPRLLGITYKAVLFY